MIVKRKRLKKGNIIIACVVVLIAIVGVWFFTRDTFPKELIEIDSSTKKYGEYTLTTSDEEGLKLGLHAPKFDDETLNTWNLSRVNQIQEQITTDTTKAKVDYRSDHALDAFTSVEYYLYENDELTQTQTRTWYKDKELENISTFTNKLGVATIKTQYPDIDINSSNIYIYDETVEIDGQSIPFSSFVPYLKDDIGDYPAIVYRDPEAKYVVMTFDDGPHYENTEEILDILDKYNAHGTFFMLGTNIENYPEIVKDIYDRGHQVANHSYNHPNLTSLTKEEVLYQINTTDKLIRDITKSDKPIMIRPPYGAVNDEVKSYVDNLFINWSVDTVDWKHKDKQQTCSIVSDSEDGDIVLQHDIHQSTAKSLDCSLKALTDKGYEIVSVEELMAIRDYDFNTKDTIFSLPYKE